MTDMSSTTPQSGAMPAGSIASTADPSLITYTHVIYALHALSVVIGITSAATIVGAFVFGLPSIIAVIMNYVRRGDARGSYLESHFNWQIRTFWFALLWMVIAGLISAPLVLLLLLGFVTYMIAGLVVGAWVIYRVARGWLALRDGRSIAA